ncbi:AarF/UbiB family protein [Domibacillus sp. A3M-37]|uniref:ABC1 kinase family protein n=1 Tax=Domibacillus sp. A3M-37 TaxID=2962037 RepID=UPI0020B8785F|nr:AarF/UbiB family protein [Domibacillus sp. A3M-37]MCP3761672.1 AarF/UbiB family protein [Domibacillus sp. A3M-37]
MVKIGTLRRAPEIVAVFAKHGFAGYIKDLGLAEKIPFTRWGAKEQNVKGEQLRRALEELGPTFMKLGQFLSTRTDLLPPSWTDPLAKLQNSAPAMPYEAIKKIVESEAGQPLEDWLIYMEEIPLGAASIGQVHRAALKDGTEVAIKIRRPGIEPVIRNDVSILRQLANLAERNSELARQISLKAIIDDFAAALGREMNYRMEAMEAVSVRDLMKEKRIYVPRIFPEWTTERMLVMEFVSGKSLRGDVIAAIEVEERRELARALSETVLRQVFIDGIFHADPHPGNLLLLKDGRLGLIDFGNTGRLSDDMKHLLSDCLFALADRDAASLSMLVLEMGARKPIERRLLQRDISRWMAGYMDIELADVQMGAMLQELFMVAGSHHITIPKDFVQVGQAFLKVEQTVIALDPASSLSGMVRDMAHEVLMGRVHPKEMMRESRSFLRLFKMAAVKLPGILNETLNEWEGGQPKLKMHLTADDNMMRRIERMASLIVLSVIMLAFSIIMAGIFVSMGNQSPISDSNTYHIALITALIMTILFMTVLYLMWRRIK